VKKKIFLSVLLSATALLALSACGDEKPVNNGGSSSVVDNGGSQNQGGSEGTQSQQGSSEGQQGSQGQQGGEGQSQAESTELATNKSAAITKLDELINPVIAKITNDELKAAIQTYYDTEKQYINGITDVDTAKAALNKVVEDTKTFAVTTLKPLAVTKLNAIINPLIAAIPNDTLKASVQTFYNTEMAKVDAIETLDNVATTYKEILDDTKDYIKTETAKVVVALKNKALEELDKYVEALIAKITNESLKTDLQAQYVEEKKLLAAVDTIEGVPTCIETIKSDLLDFAVQETIKLAIAALDPYVNALIDKIPYDTVKTDTQAEYAKEKKTLEAVTKLDDIPTCVEKIKKDLADFAVAETIKVAVAALDDVIDAGLAKLPNQKLKSDLEGFENDEIEKLEAVTKVEDVPTTLTTVLQETEAYIKSLLASVVKDYLTKLTKIETATAYDYLPEAMAPSYEPNKVTDASSINYDFTTFTNVSAIQKAGYGEQWQMVVENINQSITMAKVFNVAQTALNAATQAVNAYIENSYAEEMEKELSGDGYTGKFAFKDDQLMVNINITTSITVPGVGTVKPVVKMVYDLSSETKSMFISLGDAYKVKYLVSNDAYEMATTYGVTIAGVSGSRTSYLSVVNNETKTIGHIYEYTTINGSDKISACADFYVENDYVSVVGNKASGLAGFDGYVTELYKASEGRLLGYEVKEEKTINVPLIGKITGTYNTLWFNLWDISGITSIKVTDKTDENPSSRSTVDVYLNGSNKLLYPKYNTKFSRETSRKFDIELRSRFYYTYDSENKTYVAHEVKVPMMFIQEDNDNDTNFTDYPSDMEKAYGIESSVTMDQADLNKVLADYDTLIEIFIKNKKMTSDDIKEYLAQFE